MNFKPTSQFEIDLSKYKIKSTIGRGGYSLVYRMIDTTTKKNFAAKIIQREFCDSIEQYNNVVDNELKVMLLSKHPTIIKFVGFSMKDFNGQNNFTIIMQYAANKSLSNFLDKVRNYGVNFTNTNKQIILTGVARGMKYLHDRNIIHFDLKPGNILLDKNHHPLISDFGLVDCFSAGKSMSQRDNIGTYRYMAPEMLSDKETNRKADVYSFGIVMFEVLTHEKPFPEMPIGEVIDEVIQNNIRPKTKKQIKDPFMKLIDQCLSAKIDDRPTFTEIFKKLSTDKNYLLDNVDKSEFNSYVHEITEIDEPIDELNLKLESAENLNKTISDENEHLKAEIENFKKDFKQISKDNELLKNEISDFKNYLIQICKDNELFKMQIDQLKKQNNQLEISNKNLQNNLNTSNERNSMIDKILCCIKHELKKLNIKELEDINEIRSIVNFKINELQSVINPLTNQLKTLQADLNVTNFNVKKLTKSYQEDHTLKNECYIEIKKILDGTIQTLNDMKEKINQDQNVKDSPISNLTSEFQESLCCIKNGLKKLIIKESEDVKELQTKINELQSMINPIKNQLKTLQISHQRQQSQNESYFKNNCNESQNMKSKIEVIKKQVKENFEDFNSICYEINERPNLLEKESSNNNSTSTSEINNKKLIDDRKNICKCFLSKRFSHTLKKRNSYTIEIIENPRNKTDLPQDSKYNSLETLKQVLKWNFVNVNPNVFINKENKKHAIPAPVIAIISTFIEKEFFDKEKVDQGTFDQAMEIFENEFPHITMQSADSRFNCSYLIMSIINSYKNDLKFDKQRIDTFNKIFQPFVDISATTIVMPILPKFNIFINRFITGSFDVESLNKDFKIILDSSLNEFDIDYNDEIDSYLKKVLFALIDKKMANGLLSNPSRFNQQSTSSWIGFLNSLESSIDFKITKQLINCLIKSADIAINDDLRKKFCPDLDNKLILFMLKHYIPDMKLNQHPIDINKVEERLCDKADDFHEPITNIQLPKIIINVDLNHKIFNDLSKGGVQKDLIQTFPYLIKYISGPRI